eukprot:CAMPEP_0183294366 /NCGR_PEP_ID=MMETSP0160_2-20130417/2739_1 /TAXON_ID=2839 ORGANISM="Odontella Sinensis, Strain Grunow 1884" /NCGR_SAMPLE_ID=MMETSP0160_2 /ASSEMBLY_ACC=CAM_ASM_000250 /LENGTH=251 /DNA_ID=CAMNT_0025455685 /DNA_START=91 /DNA_END=846 /DNA_ORIENTATION=+
MRLATLLFLVASGKVDARGVNVGPAADPRALSAFMTRPSSSSPPQRSAVVGMGDLGRQRAPLSATTAPDDECAAVPSRRRALLSGIAALSLLGGGVPTSPANAVVMERPKGGGAFKEQGTALTQEQAEVRLREARKSAAELLERYDEICEGGGDNVRRYLGTVGITSGLYGISKVMKTLSERADDIVEYTETAQEVEKCIQQADGSAYMAIFVTTSTSYDPPSKYFGEAKVEVKRLGKALDDLAALIDLKY